MKKKLILIIIIFLTSNTIKSQEIVLDSNGVTIKWTGTNVPSPYFIQANPRGTGMEWFAIVSNSKTSQIRDYASGLTTGKTFFTPPGSTTPIPFNNIVTTFVTNMSYLLNTNARNFNKAIESWDVSNVTKMVSMFHNTIAFNQPIGSWDVSNVTDMTNMFYNATAFNQPIDNWDTRSVTNMKSMFYNATAFDKYINSWNVSNVTDMSNMFSNSIEFNQPIGSWNVSNVTNMRAMFNKATAFNQPIGNWNVSNVTDMYYMFSNTPFNQPIGNWNVFQVTDMSNMFSNTPFNQPIGNWNVSNVSDMSGMFSNTPFNQPIGDWDVSNVTNMNLMFNNSGLSTANYDAALIGWTTINFGEGFLKPNVLFNAGTSKYCNGASARGILTSEPNNWTIADGGIELDCRLVLDSNGVTIKYMGTSVPKPYLIQADPRGNGLEWFAIIDNSMKAKIQEYAKGLTSGITFFTPPGSSTPIPFNNIVTTFFNEMVYLFYDITDFNQRIDAWDTSKAIGMSDMFNGASAFNQPIDAWDTSKVINMSNMFNGASAFNQPIDAWDTSKVINMSGMFNGASAFNQPIDAWDTSKVVNLIGMFSSATAFNQPIGSWNVSEVLFMIDMFNNSGLSTTNYDATLIGWSTITAIETAVKPNINFNAGTSKYCNSASARGILTSAPNNWTITDGGLDCSDLPKIVLDSNNITLKYSGTTIPSPYLIQANLRGTGTEWFAIVDNTTKSKITDYAKGIQSGIDYFIPTGVSTPIPFNNIVTTLITDMSFMFTYSTSVNFSDTNLLFNQPIGSWDVSNVTNMDNMFSNSIEFNQPIGSWNVSNVTNMRGMFYKATAFNQPIGSWDVSKVTNMQSMFNRSVAFNQSIDSWNVGNVTNMSFMFYNASAFNQPIGSWNVSNVTTMDNMFREATAFNKPIGSWDVSSVSDMRSMFYDATSFNQPISSWDVSKVYRMSFMFYNASAFNQPIGSWDMSNVTDMKQMFQLATTFNQPIGSWNVSNVTTMDNMFREATAFNKPIGSWDVSSVTDMRSMFYDATSFNQPISSWDVSKVYRMSFMFYNALAFNQPIGSWDISKVTNMGDMFSGASLSTDNYDTTLIGWASKTLTPNVVFSGGNSTYCNSANARSSIINTYGWTITDGGQDCSSLNIEELNRSSLKLYPNPVISFLHVDNNLTNQSYNIIDTLGKVILKGNLNEGNNMINVDKLSKGIYYLKVLDRRATSFIKK
jgi:surface protein